MSDVLLDLRDLEVTFATPRGPAHVVNGVSYTLRQGETLGIVGESGSGKTLHLLAMLGLTPPPPVCTARGQALFAGRDLLRLSQAELRDVRGAEVGMIFQDPMSALNPVLTIGRQIMESLIRHRKLSKAAAREKAIRWLGLVGIVDPERTLSRYPHELSGGMRQRVMIAIAMCCKPRLLIADEATTALDVTVQAQILDLVESLRERFNMAVIWVSHDMGVVAGIADTVQVMYAGQVLERGPIRSVFHDTRHAYTRGLLESIPSDGEGGGRLRQIPGSPPDPRSLPPGDPFAPRHPQATARCRTERPPLAQVDGGAPGHLAAAWYDLRTMQADKP